MNCQTLQSQIDDSPDKTDLSGAESQHLETCAACRNFNHERERLRALVQTLETVNAPADFNFRLKARLREAEKNTKFSAKRQLIWLAPATLAAAVCAAAFVNFQRAPAPPQIAENQSAPSIAVQTENAPQEKTATVLPPDSVDNAVEEVARKEFVNTKNRRVQNQNKVFAVSAARSGKVKFKEKQVFSKDSALSRNKTEIMPVGIPNLQRAVPQILNAKDLLRTFGIEIAQEIEGLRVVSIGEHAARKGLQKNDLIEKINDKTPANLSNESNQPLKMTVRREKQTLQVEIKD